MEPITTLHAVALQPSLVALTWSISCDTSAPTLMKRMPAEFPICKTPTNLAENAHRFIARQALSTTGRGLSHVDAEVHSNKPQILNQHTVTIDNGDDGALTARWAIDHSHWWRRAIYTTTTSPSLSPFEAARPFGQFNCRAKMISARWKEHAASTEPGSVDGCPHGRSIVEAVVIAKGTEELDGQQTSCLRGRRPRKIGARRSEPGVSRTKGTGVGAWDSLTG
jgi:hypothetical protein